MDYLQQFKQKAALQVFVALLFVSLGTLAVTYASAVLLDSGPFIVLISAGSTAMGLSLLVSWLLTRIVSAPVTALSEIVRYAAHPLSDTPAPTFEHIHIGRELLEGLSKQIYDLASNTQPAATPAQPAASSDLLLQAFALPVIGIDSEQRIVSANVAAAQYVGKNLPDILQKPLFDVFSFSFQGDQTFEDWLVATRQSTVTAHRSWERVRHIIDQDNWKQFDMVASFSSGASSGVETLIALFDKTERYQQDDQEISFVALAVHELRTPLTIMRGYIEVFEDELGPQLSPELTDFMHKMHASAQQLTAFVSNILNVARVEENQLALKLREESIAQILQTAVADLQLRAKVHGKTIELTIAPDLPSIAADRISLHEVINNLVDNAIKYSGNSASIKISCALNKDGVVQTDVQDFGIGIPAAVMPELFKKFHRSHKSRVQIGGTGLGLYLCKALITAHGGNIWVRSKEGEGSIFSFTVVPFDAVKHEQTNPEDGIIRGAHGWIKNHSLYRN